jgi:uncharacterized protein YraI
MYRLMFILFALLTAQVEPTETDICRAAYQTAIAEAAANCTEVGPNQVCHTGVTLDLREGELPDTIGTAVDAAAVESIETDTYSDDTYSFALLYPQANLTGDPLRMMVLAGTTVINQSDATMDFYAVNATVSHPQGANARTGPDGDQVGVIYRGTEVQITGRSADGAWLRVNDDDGMAWISTDVVRLDNVMALPVVEPGDPSPRYGPMQAFTLRSTPDDSPCPGVPDGGAVLTTPNLTQRALVEVNGVVLRFAGTVYLQAAGGELLVTVMEGDTFIDDTYTVRVGELARVNEDFAGETEPYIYYKARYVPVPLLPRPLDLPLSLAGSLRPWEPGSGFLQSIPADGPCTIAWATDVNFRAGPGTDFRIRQGVPANFSAQPSGRATGTDGFVWWRIDDDIWVIAEATTFGGACDQLAWVLAPLPENE